MTQGTRARCLVNSCNDGTVRSKCPRGVPAYPPPTTRRSGTSSCSWTRAPRPGDRPTSTNHKPSKNPKTGADRCRPVKKIKTLLGLKKKKRRGGKKKKKKKS